MKPVKCEERCVLDKKPRNISTGHGCMTEILLKQSLTNRINKYSLPLLTYLAFLVPQLNKGNKLKKCRYQLFSLSPFFGFQSYTQAMAKKKEITMIIKYYKQDLQRHILNPSFIQWTHNLLFVWFNTSQSPQKYDKQINVQCLWYATNTGVKILQLHERETKTVKCVYLWSGSRT